MGQKLQRWRISSTPVGQEKGQTQAQLGGSLHNRPSPDWWSKPSAKCIGQPTRAEPMECSTPTKILRLAPDSVFVSFLCHLPFFNLAAWYFSPPSSLLSPKPLGACLRDCSHIIDAPPVLIIPRGFFIRSLYTRASCPKHV